MGSGKRWGGTVAVVLAGASLSWADVKVPAVIGDHMVVQQGVPVPIWGKAAPGEAVTVTFAGQVKTAVAAADGRWLVRLDALQASAGTVGEALSIVGKNRIAVQDVLVGETWLCSGQSNMQMPVRACKDAAQETAAADHPAIRMFTVANRTAATPQEDCEGQWDVCSPETVGAFSAVGYSFGRHLHETLNVPVGLLNSSWGGTVAEAWVSDAALRTNLPEFGSALDAVGTLGEAYHRHYADYGRGQAAHEAGMAALLRMEEDLVGAAPTVAYGFDDSTWKSMELPGSWESRGLPGLDGIVWFRKAVDLPAAWVGKDVVLHLGPIDEVDVVWFNGVQVGGLGRTRTHEVQYWDQPRDYRVPGALVRAGRNEIAVRVSDTGGNGGLWGAPAETLRVEGIGAVDPAGVPLAGEWRYWVALALPPRLQNPPPPAQPTVLFNAMIQPLMPFAIRGTIWYQGEANADRADQYRRLLPTLITDWRARFGVGDFPFLVVQLANYNVRADEAGQGQWAELREAQALAATTTPNAGLALAIDVGEAEDIHPRNKQEVGRRLGLVAEALAYGRTLVHSGPVFAGMSVKEGEAALRFDHADGGLKARGDVLKGFVVCGAERKFVPAQARIEGDRVIVSAAEVPHPVAVRYSWSDNPDGNLVNGADLPAVPFRTDRP